LAPKMLPLVIGARLARPVAADSPLSAQDFHA
jgi:hypothetical protein